MRAQLRHHTANPVCVHVQQQLADKIAQQVGAQRPAGAEIAKHPHQIGQTSEHGAAPCDAVTKVQRLAIDLKVDVAKYVEVKTRGGDDHIRRHDVAVAQANAFRHEAVNLAGHHTGLAGAHGFEKVAIGHEGQALLPRPVARFEMHIGQVGVLWAEGLSDACQQFCRHSIGFLDTTLLYEGLIMQDLATHDFVSPFVGDVQCAQRVGQFVGVAARRKPCGRSLQHGDVLTASRQRRHQRRGGRA